MWNVQEKMDVVNSEQARGLILERITTIMMKVVITMMMINF